jgi:hypothetical protein
MEKFVMQSLDERAKPIEDENFKLIEKLREANE